MKISKGDIFEIDNGYVIVIKIKNNNICIVQDFNIKKPRDFDEKKQKEITKKRLNNKYGHIFI